MCEHNPNPNPNPNKSESIAKLATALAKAQGEFRPVGKSGKNTSQNYTYADLDDYMAIVRPVLAKYDLSITSTVLSCENLPDRKTRSGSIQFGARVLVATKLIHASGEWLEATAYGDGLDTGDKAIYKAITGGRKFALASLLGLATSDDPEKDTPEQSNHKQLSAPKDKNDIKIRSQKAIDKFADWYVIKEDLEALLGTKREDWGEEEINELLKLYLELQLVSKKDRSAKIIEVFNLEPEPME